MRDTTKPVVLSNIGLNSLGYVDDTEQRQDDESYFNAFVDAGRIMGLRATLDRIEKNDREEREMDD